MENIIKKLAGLFGIDSEDLKKWVVHMESTKKEYYEKKEEEIKRTSDEIKAAKEKQKE